VKVWKTGPVERATLDLHAVTLLVFLHETLPVMREVTVRPIIKDTIVVYFKKRQICKMYGHMCICVYLYINM